MVYGAQSPLVASYEQWTFGTPAAVSLPREPNAFLTGAFGPLSPMVPTPVDEPQDGDRPEPRRWQYPVGWNMPIGVPGTEGLKLASFENLRLYADMYSVVRSCIQLRKAEIRGLEWDIVPTEDAEKLMRGDTKAHADFAERRAKVVKFFSRPDPDYHDWYGWLDAMLEEVFVTDALALYLHPTRAAGKGLLGSDLAALDIIDGTTIRPLVDMRGGRPKPPNPAYQQYLYGVPRVDLQTLMEFDDDLGKPTAEYRGDHLLYLPYTRRAWTPYGFPGLERALVPTLAGLQRQLYQLDFFTEGSIPGTFVSPGNDVTNPQQIRMLQDQLNAIAGDPKWKHRIIVLPGGSTPHAMKPVQLADQFDEIVMSQVCMSYDVQPMELGITPKVSTTQSVGAANQMAKAAQDINQRKALRPMLYWLKIAIFDYILQRVCGQKDMQWSWIGLQQGEDEATQTDVVINQVSHGLMSIDEGRITLGKAPWGLPITSDPGVMLQTGFVPLGAIDMATGKPVGAQQIIPGQPEGQPAPTLPAGTPGPPKPTGTGPGRPPKALPAAKPAAPGPTPAHEANAAPRNPSLKAALAEIDAIRRAAKRGRDVSTWIAKDCSQETVDLIAYDLRVVGLDDAIAKARQATLSSARLGRREVQLQQIKSTVAKKLGVAGNRMRNGQMSRMTWLDQARKIMHDGIAAAVQAGAKAASSDLGVGFVPDLTNVLLADLDEESNGYLINLEADLLPALNDEELDDVIDTGERGDILVGMANRLDMWGQKAANAFEAGYGTTVLAQPGQTYSLVWHTGGSEPCALCKARDGVRYTEDTLPGWPGDGSFGELCLGGPRCQCYIDFVRGGKTAATGQNTMHGTDVAPDHTAMQQRQVIRQRAVQDARKQFVENLPAGPQQRAQARDQARASIAQERGILPQDVPAADVRSRMNIAAAANPDLVKAMGPIAAGLAVVAADTGRVLMLQRALSEGDAAAGKWEFPGGHIEDGEEALDAAKREWTEETGATLPDGTVTGGWTSPNGVYQGFVYLVSSEADVPINLSFDDREVINPDDPDGDITETLAWHDVNDLPANPALRAECYDTPWNLLRDAPYPQIAKYSSDQPRDSHGRFAPGSGGGGGGGSIAAFQPITAAEARGNSRAVSAAQFQAIAAEGQGMLDEMHKNASSPSGLDAHWDAVKAESFAACQKSWGGATIDAHTGRALETSADKYALSVKPAGMKSVSINENATRAEFDAAMDKARSQFVEQLRDQNRSLGVFHDDENHRIDIDPVTVVDSVHQVEAIGAATHAIGGAYHFADGNGYWPPHVAASSNKAATEKTVHWKGPGQWHSFAERVQK